MKRWILAVVTLGCILAPSGCATVGHSFPVDAVSRLEIGTTSMDDVRRMFGTPWRTGIDNGDTTWTYGHYKYKLFGSANTKDLVVRFNKQNIVTSYTFNTTEHDEKNK